MFLRYESLRQYIRLYPVTSLILAVQIVLFIWMEAAGSSQSGATLLRFGAMYGVPGEQPEMWRYVSSIFLHMGFTHLLFNSFALFVFAPPLERILGHFRYLFFYLVSGVAGNICGKLLHTSEYLSVGASGAIYGIYAAYLFLGVFRKELLDRQTRQTVTAILVIGFIQSFVIPHVDIYAHVGGAVGGFLLMAVLSPRIAPGRE